MVSFTLDGKTEYWLYLRHGVDISSAGSIALWPPSDVSKAPLCLSGILSICLYVICNHTLPNGYLTN